MIDQEPVIDKQDTIVIDNNSQDDDNNCQLLVGGQDLNDVKDTKDDNELHIEDYSVDAEKNLDEMISDGVNEDQDTKIGEDNTDIIDSNPTLSEQNTNVNQDELVVEASVTQEVFFDEHDKNNEVQVDNKEDRPTSLEEQGSIDVQEKELPELTNQSNIDTNGELTNECSEIEQIFVQEKQEDIDDVKNDNITRPTSIIEVKQTYTGQTSSGTVNARRKLFESMQERAKQELEEFKKRQEEIKTRKSLKQNNSTSKPEENEKEETKNDEINLNNIPEEENVRKAENIPITNKENELEDVKLTSSSESVKMDQKTLNNDNQNELIDEKEEQIPKNNEVQLNQEKKQKKTKNNDKINENNQSPKRKRIKMKKGELIRPQHRLKKKHVYEEIERRRSLNIKRLEEEDKEILSKENDFDKDLNNLESIQFNFIKLNQDLHKNEIKSKENQLLWIKGKRNVRIHAVPCLASSLNHGDVFILDLHVKIYIWTGEKANRKEKEKAKEILEKMKENNKNIEEIIHLDYENHNKYPEFWKNLNNGNENEILSELQGGNDIEFERDCDQNNLQLLKIEKTKNNNFLIKQIEITKKLSKEYLSSNHCFILYCRNELYQWIGKNTNKEIIEYTNNYIEQEYLNNNEKCKNILYYSKNIENNEEFLFYEKFFDWNLFEKNFVAISDHKNNFSNGKSLVRRKSMLMGRIKKNESNKLIDVTKLHTCKLFPDDFKKLVFSDDDDFDLNYKNLIHGYIVRNGSLEIDNDILQGKFYSSELYFLTFSLPNHKKSNKQIYIYIWKGYDYKNDFENSFELIKKLEIDLQCKLNPSNELIDLYTEFQIPFKESYQFLHFFNGKMIIYKGLKCNSNLSNSSYRFFSILSHSDPLCTRTIEISLDFSLLNSRHCFFIQNNSKEFAWFGGNITNDQKSFAESLVQYFLHSRSLVTYEEGNEDKKFWKLFPSNCKKQNLHLYYSISPKKKPFLPRFFVCSGFNNDFKVHPIWNVIQEDLHSNEAMIVDVYYEVYIWFGKNIHEETKIKATETATVSQELS